MVNILASRMAGIKLGWVVFTLLVPVAILGYLINSDIQSRLDTTRREIAGTQLLALVVPLFQAEASGKQADTAKLHHDGSGLARSLGLETEFKELLQNVAAKSDTSTQLMQTRNFIDAVHRGSGVVLDASPESSNIASFTMLDVPAIQMGFRDLQGQVKELGSQHRAAPAVVLQISEQAVRLQVALDAALDHMQRATSASPATADYADIRGKLLAARAIVSDQLIALRKSFAAQDFTLDSLASGLDKSESGFTDAVNRAWNTGTVRLQTILGDHEAIVSTKSIAMIGMSIASILVALFSALRMFRSSLVRLDDLETSKFAAETARHDAEDMNARLTMINNEIVNLNTELADKMRRLKEAQDELLRKGRMEQLGQLTATVAHELRNPLGAVRTSAFLLERKLKDKGLGVEAQLTRINNGITRCDSIITQLLDFSRTKQVAASPADLDAWLATTIEEEARRIPAAVAIDCTLGLDARQVPFDPARLQRAVINLISNAAEAMVGTGDDPSKFTVSNPVIRVATRVEADMAVLEVSDNGPGIPAEIVDKIREPLFTTKSFGTGLGIPAVEQIVVQHGGRLDISSQPGQGARFSLYLPFKIPQAEAA
jgi:signal transduction histidine kinase